MFDVILIVVGAIVGGLGLSLGLLGLSGRVTDMIVLTVVGAIIGAMAGNDLGHHMNARQADIRDRTS